MNKKDFLWGLALAIIITFLLYPTTHVLFINFNGLHPYLAGFLKFALLATLGDLLAARIVSGDWKMPNGLFFRMAIWGFLGMVIVIIFNIFAGGVTIALSKGLLPFNGSNLAFAFFTSAIMNMTFAPTMMAFHRFTDTYADFKFTEKKENITIDMIANKIDWNSFVSFVIIKTVPLFWIPAHTITFLLPAEYRVLAAAFLSIALGAILSFAKRK
ncbi:MAG: Mpv17/PMP22 family protein [Bacillota bacterium]|nr:Mpv17/PMP22 family protein [Bacillota bacterium]